ncbi:MAG: sodium-translocating pyrophosphatase [Nannocystaceae bacterium]|nr:sodium-translocating pyrophosphatase [bacterium]
MEQLIYLLPIAGVVALAYSFVTTGWIGKQDAGNSVMKTIADQISKGAMAFLSAEYKVLAGFVVVVAGLLVVMNTQVEGGSPLIGLAFVTGAAASAFAGYLGMKVATQANVRTAAAARKGLPPALTVAFRGGAVMGMSVVGLALLGLGLLFILFAGQLEVFNDAGGLNDQVGLVKTVNLLAGFSMGASSIALFARVGGGIYTKAADVGADLVGKVEAGIPEDHPLNPATIADNVGDNVGDVAGMGADLFESYVASIVGAMILGAVASNGSLEMVMLPVTIAAIGVIVSVVFTYFVRVKEGGNPQIALDGGSFGAAGIMLALSWFIIDYFVGAAAESGGLTLAGKTLETVDLFVPMAGGLAAGVAIGVVTGYYCSKNKPPVNSIVDQSMTGPATNIIAGISVGFRSTAIPVLIIAAAIFGANHFAGVYGVALAALGMLSTTGIQLAVDAYGPISDNAGGIAEMSGLPPEVRERTDNLDAVGNTTAAIGKGFAIGSAALASLSLFAAYKTMTRANMELTDPEVLIGLLLGAMLPFLFSAMAMQAVGDAAMDMITEVRRQFREIPSLRPALAKVKAAEDEDRALSDEEQAEIMEAAKDTQVERCVAISTQASIKRMVAPGLLALVAPVLIGFWSTAALGGLLAGTLVAGVMLAIFMSNAGGAWDNAKKQVEDQKRDYDASVNTGKGSDRHKASVIGDTVGDPFKDTAGPALNILIKVMTIVAVVIAPFLV